MLTRALLSVSDKSGIQGFAKSLTQNNIQIISTGGTKKVLEDNKIPVTLVEDITDFPSCFGGRVKTMHPKIVGGILMRQNNSGDKQEARDLEIQPIDIVVVNLYPFGDRVRGSGSGINRETVELIDIGGVTLLRAAAKNADHVTVICDPDDYEWVIDEIQRLGDTTPETRKRLAAKAFLHTAAYDGMIAQTLGNDPKENVIPPLLNPLPKGEERSSLRYGENPHQKGWFLRAVSGERRCPAVIGVLSGLAESGYINVNNSSLWKQLQGKEMSYCNILDVDSAWRVIQDFADPTSVCVKHANPCGIASDTDITGAFQKSFDADSLSAFGVIIALNRECTKDIIQKIIDQKIFTEVIMAPGFKKEAVELLKKRPKIRVIECRMSNVECRHQSRTVLGGLLTQEQDTKILTNDDLVCVTKKKPTSEQIQDLLFAWHTVKHATSNAIVFAKDCASLGIGNGQTSRIDALQLAVYKAKRTDHSLKGSVMASDAFFPFADSIEEAARVGACAIIQPGGSVRDKEVIAKANELHLSMVFTGTRAFKH